MAMPEVRHLHLVDRLRGQYHLPVNDGCGPLNGSMTFSREFETPPIQHEAAAEIERLTGILKGVEIALARDSNIEAAMELILSCKSS